MKRTIISFMLAAALSLGTSLPVFAQGSEEADKAFAKYDADKDGKLNRTEFSKVTTPDGKKASIQEWDGDDDGFVSKAEFRAKYGASSGSQPPKK